MKEFVLTGKWSLDELDRLMNESSIINEAGKRIAFLSNQFLGVEYKESTLIGDMNTPEVFVINLEGMDCFTFIDYVEAMRLSISFNEFIKNLKRIRYCNGIVSFENRNHFFTDWVVNNSGFMEDVTEQLGKQKIGSITKILNKKKDDTCFLAGVQPGVRTIKYIPAEAVDELIISKLMTGDYAGIYSKEDGLDVSHVGIIIKKNDGIYLRHASSGNTHRKVTDEEFISYIKNKPGLIVIRPKQTTLFLQASGL